MFFSSPLAAEKFLPTAYNSFAGEFSSTRHSKWPEFETLGEGTKLNGNIADIGCGNGRLFHFLTEKNFTGTYTGVDVSENLLDHAKKNTEAIEGDKKFISGGFLNLPLPKNSYDEIWAVASFHHVSQHKDRITALQNIAGCLKENGDIVLTVWNLWEQEKYEPQKHQAKISSLWNPTFSDRDFLIPWGKQKTPRYYYSFSEGYLREILLRTGFEVEKFFYSDQKKNICVRAKKKPISEGKKFTVESVPFDTLTFDESIEKFFFFANQKTGYKKVYTPNPEMLVEAKTNKKFLSVLQSADLSLADANGILWASGIEYLQDKNIFWRWVLGIFSLFGYAFFRKNFPAMISSPICGSDFFRIFLEQSQEKHLIDTATAPQIFLLGGSEGSAKYINKKFSTIAGYFDGMVNEKNIPKILEQINSSGANVLFVALGAPKQEIFIAEQEKFLPNIRVAMGVGGSFDFISGHQVRAPKNFRTLGIEWLYRLIKEPSRVGRIWTATGRFIAQVLNK